MLDEQWLEPDRVLRLRFDGDPVRARSALEVLPADVFVRPVDAPLPRLMVADMDATMIENECIDELADMAGVGREVAAITEAAMRGELDFAAALCERVALLRGMEEATLARVYEERVRITSGARTLVRTLKAHGARTILVSGGFIHFADRVAAEIGFDEARANRLIVEAGRLTGEVAAPTLDAAAKRDAMEAAAAALGTTATLAVGDGANDVPMLRAARYGVAYRAKPAAIAASDAAVRHGDLTTILHGLGVPRADWRT